MFKKYRKWKEDTFSKYSPRQKSIMFFGFYAVFFLVLFLFLNTLPKGEIRKKEPALYSFNLIQKNNFHFNYELVTNLGQITLNGERLGLKEKFIRTDIEGERVFFKDNDTILEKVNETYQLAEMDPYFYSPLLDISKIKELVEKGSLISKTEFTNKETNFVYHINHKDFVKLVDDQDIEETTDIISMILFVKDKEVFKIEMDIGPFSIYKMEPFNEAKITLTFDEFGKIKELTQD